jgi:hypothetical protein
MPAVAEQHIADEEVALEHRARVFREGRADDGEALAGAVQRVQQRLGHGADVALRRAVEGGAVLEVDLLRALRLQPAQGVERLGHRVGRRDGARFQRHDDRIGFGIQGAVGNTDGLHHAHAGAHQVVGQIGGAGEVVGNAAENRLVFMVSARSWLGSRQVQCPERS